MKIIVREEKGEKPTGLMPISNEDIYRLDNSLER